MVDVSELRGTEFIKIFICLFLYFLFLCVCVCVFHDLFVVAIVVLGTLVVTRQFVGESIICWSPNEFNSQWQQYVDSYCWVMNTNYLPLTSHHDAIIDGYAPRLIRYYQWTPLILFTQGQY